MRTAWIMALLGAAVGFFKVEAAAIGTCSQVPEGSGSRGCSPQFDLVSEVGGRIISNNSEVVQEVLGAAQILQDQIHPVMMSAMKQALAIPDLKFLILSPEEFRKAKLSPELYKEDARDGTAAAYMPDVRCVLLNEQYSSKVLPYQLLHELVHALAQAWQLKHGKEKDYFSANCWGEPTQKKLLDTMVEFRKYSKTLHDLIVGKQGLGWHDKKRLEDLRSFFPTSHSDNFFGAVTQLQAQGEADVGYTEREYDWSIPGQEAKEKVFYKGVYAPKKLTSKLHAFSMIDPLSTTTAIYLSVVGDPSRSDMSPDFWLFEAFTHTSFFPVEFLRKEAPEIFEHLENMTNEISRDLRPIVQANIVPYTDVSSLYHALYEECIKHPTAMAIDREEHVLRYIESRLNEYDPGDEKLRLIKKFLQVIKTIAEHNKRPTTRLKVLLGSVEKEDMSDEKACSYFTDNSIGADEWNGRVNIESERANCAKLGYHK